ncbi:hypothetical protein TAMA11512_19570 [Selenomonas sp. TAMA-11512]|uniref:histidine kinase n=1 Tax=Selenomonas sp. TAMA-11512 TaxID=3095337 RepID=UPI00308F071E|nr:hypothetical protein TAMA11512_19570 [Selenomonas sp. TAMA-11512]
MNKKAEVFDAMLEEQKIESFDRSELKDSFNGVLYRTTIDVKNQYLPVFLTIDASIYSVVRIILGDRIVNDDNRAAMDKYINEINRSQKVFKYYYADDGTLFVDACIVSSDESFEPRLVQVVLEVVIEHLKKTYGDTMSIIWNVDAPESERQEEQKELD